MAIDSPNLVLERTRLQFDGNFLTWTNDSGQALVRLPTQSLGTARYAMRLSKFGLVCLLACFAINYVAYVVAGNTLIQITTHIFGIAIGAFGLLGIVQDKIVIESASGRIEIRCNDQKDNVRNFAISLNEAVKHQKENQKTN